MTPGPIRLGTSSWTAKGWERSFYPKGVSGGDRIGYYATRFDTVEIDMTYYRPPSAAMVAAWRERTPEGFLFAAKAPQVATCDYLYRGGKRERNPDFLDPEALQGFLAALDGLGDRLGPILLQFPYLARGSVAGREEFFDRFAPLAGSLPPGIPVSVEIRNPSWFGPELLEFLRERQIGLCLTDLRLTRADGGEYGPPRGPELYEKYGKDLVTGDHVFIRWLGNRKRIEQKTKVFDAVIEPRDRDLAGWAGLIGRLADLGVPVFAYANNHFEGFAPETVRKVRALLATVERGEGGLKRK